MAKHTLVVVEAAKGREAAFEELRESGEFFLVFVTRRAVPEAIGRYVDDLLAVDTNDADALIDALRAYSRGRRIDGALTLLEWYVTNTESVRAEFGLPGNGTAAALRCRDKNVMRERLGAFGVPVPRFSKVTDVRDCLHAVDQVMGFPCVVKPTDGTGSVNVALARTEPELYEAFERIECAEINSRGQMLNRSALVEQYIEGREFALDSLSIEGTHRTVAIQEYTMVPPPYFTDTGYFTPPDLASAERAAVVDVAMRTLDAVGIISGPSHCEVKWGAAGPVVMEVAARHGGAHLPELVRHTTGVRYYLEAARIACGVGSLPVPHELAAGAMQNVYAEQNGTLCSIDGVADARSVPGCVAVYTDTAGRSVRAEIRDYSDPVGRLLFTAPTPAEALSRAEDARARLRVTVTPHSRGAVSQA